MLAAYDYSSRRGAIVPLLPRVHAILTHHSADKSTFITAPGNITIWRQQMNKLVIDVNRRWIIALDDKILVGFLFYRHDGNNIIIDYLQLAQGYDIKVVELMLKKLEFDPAAREARYVKGEFVLPEIHKSPVPNEDLGTMAEAMTVIRQRYSR